MYVFVWECVQAWGQRTTLRRWFSSFTTLWQGLPCVCCHAVHSKWEFPSDHSAPVPHLVGEVLELEIFVVPSLPYPVDFGDWTWFTQYFPWTYPSLFNSKSFHLREKILHVGKPTTDQQYYEIFKAKVLQFNVIWTDRSAQKDHAHDPFFLFFSELL